MIKRWFVTMAIAAFSYALVGCGNPPGVYSVSGKVLHHGEPATGAVVYFHQESPPASALQTIPFGIVADDGSFYLTCDNLGNGCPPGKYAVLVEWRDQGDGVSPVQTKGKTNLVKRSRVRSGPDRLKGRYFDMSKPLLHAEVLPQSNTLAPFEIGG
jgi:hypothetical protein